VEFGDQTMGTINVYFTGKYYYPDSGFTVIYVDINNDLSKTVVYYDFKIAASARVAECKTS